MAVPPEKGGHRSQASRHGRRGDGEVTPSRPGQGFRKAAPGFALERLHQFLNRLESCSGVLFQGLQYGGFEMPRYRGVDGAQRFRPLPNLLERQRDSRVAGEGGLAREHFIKDQAERVNVRALIHRFALGLLGRHISRRAKNPAGGCDVFRVGARYAEIHHLQLAARGEHDVLGL